MRKYSVLLGMLCALTVAGAALAGQGGNQQGGTDKCGTNVGIANGPFVYGAVAPNQATFNGTGGTAVSASFTITAPSDSGSTVVFPGQGALNNCATAATADIAVMDLQKVGDATGNLLDPAIPLDPSSGLGAQIAAAFGGVPTSWNAFAPGDSTTITLTIDNPNVAATDYGDYAVTIKAKADGYGIGVGPGVVFTLQLRAPTAVDTTPPVVTVTKPTGDQILGVIGVEVQSYDPTGPGASGLASMDASVSSAGGAVSNQAIALTLDNTLPVAAGTTVTGTGSFTPTGGSGPAGTTDLSAFVAAARSGIGTYTINANATDVAGNVGHGSKTFAVSYAVNVTRAFSTNPCKTGGNTGCTGQFAFTVNRSNVTSDGAFMFDHTVVVKLVPASGGAALATHVYGTGDIKSCVQIDATADVYQTNFRRGDFGAAGPAAYKAEVYFLDVDGNLVLQGTSGALTF